MLTNNYTIKISSAIVGDQSVYHNISYGKTYATNTNKATKKLQQFMIFANVSSMSLLYWHIPSYCIFY